MPDAILVTVEHGGNRVPDEVADRFATPAARRALASHRGWDRGSLDAARALAAAWDAPSIENRISRLVVDANRSSHHPRVFSAFTRGLPDDLRAGLLDRWWRPHRAAVERAVRERIGSGARVVHVSVHAFAPVLRGVRRRADVALLYDPGRLGERMLCDAWLARLRDAAPDLRLRRNYPYRGVADGLTTALRRRFPGERYLGIELEFNRAVLDRGGSRTARVVDAVARALKVAVDQPGGPGEPDRPRLTR